jgi:hypothetical protein
VAKTSTIISPVAPSTSSKFSSETGAELLRIKTEEEEDKDPMNSKPDGASREISDADIDLMQNKPSSWVSDDPVTTTRSPGLISKFKKSLVKEFILTRPDAKDTSELYKMIVF